MNHSIMIQNISIINGRRIKLNRLFLCCSIIGMSILFGTYNSLFTMLAFMIGVGICIKTNLEFSICVLFFILPMATIFKLSPGQTSIFTFLQLIWVICAFYKTGLKASSKDVIVFSFTVYLLVIQIFNGGINVTATLKLSFGLLMILMIEKIAVKENYVALYFSYILGIISSSVMKYMDSSIFRISLYVNTKTERLAGATADDRTSRFSGLYGDPNYYSVNLIVALILILILYKKGKFTALQSILLSMPLFFFAAMTGSKSAFLMLVIPIILFIYVSLKNRHYVIAFASCIIIIIGIQMIFSGEIKIFSVAIQRLLANHSNINELTSGRGNIWKEFFDYISDHFFVLLFGRSLLYVLLNGGAPHNTYIDFIYQLGIVGTAWLIYIFIKVWKEIVRNRSGRNILNYSVFGVVAILYFFLSELQYVDFPFHIILCLITIGLDFKKEGVINGE